MSRMFVLGGTLTETRPARASVSEPETPSRVAAADTVPVEDTSSASVSMSPEFLPPRVCVPPTGVTSTDVVARYSLGAQCKIGECRSDAEEKAEHDGQPVSPQYAQMVAQTRSVHRAVHSPMAPVP